MAFSILWY